METTGVQRMGISPNPRKTRSLLLTLIPGVHVAIAIVTAGVEAAVGHGVFHGAIEFVRVRTVGKAAEVHIRANIPKVAGEWDAELKKAAVWTYWEGAYRDVGRDEGATIVLQVQGKLGWFWYIPLHNNIVSVGVVSDHDYLFKNRDTKDHEAIYFEEVAKCPGVQPRIANAERVAPFRVQKEYSYCSRQVAGDGWVLVGDAFGFLDPLYSSGVLLALRSGSVAADAICEGLASGNTSQTQLGKWGPDFMSGMKRMRRLVCEYYNGFSFGRFVKNNPHLKGHLTDLLIGDLFDPKVDDVIPPMDAMHVEMKNAAAAAE